MQIRPVGIVLFHSESRIDGQANGQIDEANSRFSQFCELAYKPRKSDVKYRVSLSFRAKISGRVKK